MARKVLHFGDATTIYEKRCMILK